MNNHSELTSESNVYQPTAAQLERAASLRRFNWMYVYIPLGLFGLGVLVLMGLMLWGVFSPNITGTREFVSGLADIIIIFTILPLLLLCAIVPGLAIAYIIYKQKQPKQPHGRLQLLFWRLDTLLGKTHGRIGTGMTMVSKPVIEGHARAAYFSEMFKQIKKILKRS